MVPNLAYPGHTVTCNCGISGTGGYFPGPVISLALPTKSLRFSHSSPAVLMFCLIFGSISMLPLNHRIPTFCSSHAHHTCGFHTTSWNILYNFSLHLDTGSTTINPLNNVTSIMSGHGKGGKSLGKGGAKHHRKILHDNIQG